MGFVAIDDVTPHEPLPGFTARFVHSPTMTVAYWDIKAGHRVPEHTHHHEMIVNCLAGTFEVTIDGESETLQPGGIAIIPSQAVHSAYALTDCRVIDVFTPVREDYRSLDSGTDSG